jgi:hypothetical protein
MRVHREVGLVNLALYQQILRTAERIKTLRREIDDISRELHERLDDLDIIVEEFKAICPLSPGESGKEPRVRMVSPLRKASNIPQLGSQPAASDR